jgi:hypothetical protein
MQGSKKELYHYAKLTLGVDPYFQVLAPSLKSLSFKLIS